MGSTVAPAPERRPLRLGVDGHVREPTDVDHEAVARRIAREAVRPAPRDGPQAMVTGEADGGPDIAAVGGLRDGHRTSAVEAAVPDHPRGVVAGAVGKDQLARRAPARSSRSGAEVVVESDPPQAASNCSDALAARDHGAALHQVPSVNAAIRSR